MKSITKNIFYRTAPLLVIGFFVIGGFLFTDKIVLANTVEELEYSIDSAGYLTVTSNCTTLFPSNIKGFQMLSGNYPSTSTPHNSNNGSPSVCALITQGLYTLEDGFANNTISTADGNYWIRFATAGVDYVSSDWNSDWYYVEATRAGGLWSGSNASTTSKISIENPTAQTYEENPVLFSGLYTNSDTFNQIQFELINNDFAGSLVFPNLTLGNINGQDISWSTSRVLPFQGNYSIRARLYDSSTGSTTSWSAPVDFGLGTTTISTSTRSTLPGSPTPLDCSSLDFGCHIKNALVWLFYPGNTIESLKEIYELLPSKIPFVYLYEVDDLRQELFGASSTPQTISLAFKIIPGHGTSTIELLSKSKLEAVPYADTVHDVLTWILYFLAIEYIYYRVLRSHDSNTPS